MAGKYEGNTDEDLAERLHAVTMSGMATEDAGTVEAPCGWFALVEDFEGSNENYIVREDGFGFVSVEGPFEDIAVSGVVGEGYFSPARKRFAELEAELAEWYDEDEDEDASYEGGRVEARFI